MANLKLRSTTSATDPGSTSVKGSALTHGEMDSNFILLQADVNSKVASASPTLTGTATIDNNGILQFNEATANGSNYVQIKSLASIASNYTLTLPPNDGDSGQVLTTDGSGVLTWTAKTTATPTGSQSGSNFTLASASNLDTNNNEIIDSNGSSVGVRFGSDINLTGQSIVTTANGDIKLQPNGTGTVELNKSLEVYGNTTEGRGIFLNNFNGAAPTAGQLFNVGLQIETKGDSSLAGQGGNFPTIVMTANDAQGAYPNLWLQRSKSNDPASPAFLSNNDIIFSFFGAAYDNDSLGFGANYYNKTCAVDFKASENHSAGNMGGKIEFRTETTGEAASATGDLRLTIDDDVEIHKNVVLHNQSGDPSTVANASHIYAKDDSSSSEVYVRDEAGNVTKISPHNTQGEWEYYSRNINTGKVVRVNMEQMIRDVEQLTGKTYIENE